MATSRKRDFGAGAVVEPFDSRAARVAALDSLARRDRPAEDLRRKLIDKGYDGEVVASVIERLCEEKLIDNRRYVENFVDLRASRGHGPLRIRADLGRSGVGGDLVEEAVEAYPDWIAELQRVRVKKFGAQSPSGYVDKQRQARFLAHRGYTGAQIRTALGLDIDIDADM